MTDLTTIGEVLIDLTQTGTNQQGVPLFAANPGGAPANVAVAAARLGARTAFLGKIGRDGFGDYLKSVLQENQVDVAGLRTDEGATTLAVVTVSPSGERSFRFMRGADCNLSPDEVDVRQLEGSKVLHFGSVSLTAGLSRSATIFAARHAHQKGVLVSYDPNYRASLWKTQEEAPAVDAYSPAPGGSHQALRRGSGSDDRHQRPRGGQPPSGGGWRAPGAHHFGR